MVAVILVPTLCVGTQAWTLCVPNPVKSRLGAVEDAERPDLGSHAERGNQDLKDSPFVPPSCCGLKPHPGQFPQDFVVQRSFQLDQ
jgi:hypothetical protein